MITGFNIVNLLDLVSSIGDNETKSMLSDFYCPLNHDVENFLKTRAIDFSKQGIAATHLVFASYKEKPVIVGYFTLANKVLVIPSKQVSKTLSKRLLKFALKSENTKQYTLSCPLIAQLGKNFNNNYNTLISGDELLWIACDEIKRMQLSVGGKYTYVECEDKEQLIDFYVSNGFKRINNRYLNKSEKRDLDPEYLVQLIKHL